MGALPRAGSGMCRCRRTRPRFVTARRPSARPPPPATPATPDPDTPASRSARRTRAEARPAATVQPLSGHAGAWLPTSSQESKELNEVDGAALGRIWITEISEVSSSHSYHSMKLDARPAHRPFTRSAFRLWKLIKPVLPPWPVKAPRPRPAPIRCACRASCSYCTPGLAGKTCMST